jgi:hypothetical protein
MQYRKARRFPDCCIRGDSLIDGENGIQTVQTAFLYENGVFKIISAPNEPHTQVTGISLRLGLIAGIGLDFSGTTNGFTATCK